MMAFISEDCRRCLNCCITVIFQLYLYNIVLRLYIYRVAYSSTSICVDFCDVWLRVPAQRGSAIRIFETAGAVPAVTNGAEDIFGGGSPCVSTWPKYFYTIVESYRESAAGQLLPRPLAETKKTHGPMKHQTIRWCAVPSNFLHIQI